MSYQFVYTGVLTLALLPIGLLADHLSEFGLNSLQISILALMVFGLVGGKTINLLLKKFIA